MSTTTRVRLTEAERQALLALGLPGAQHKRLSASRSRRGIEVAFATDDAAELAVAASWAVLEGARDAHALGRAAGKLLVNIRDVG